MEAWRTVRLCNSLEDGKMLAAVPFYVCFFPGGEALFRHNPSTFIGQCRPGLESVEGGSTRQGWSDEMLGPRSDKPPKYGNCHVVVI